MLILFEVKYIIGIEKLKKMKKDLNQIILLLKTKKFINYLNFKYLYGCISN